MGKREQNAQKTRVAILETADRLIAERGYEQISVAEITRTAGIAKGTFYNYFEKKEDLIRALYHSHFEVLNTGIDALVAGDACAGLRAYLEGFADVVVQADVMQARGCAICSCRRMDGQSGRMMRMRSARCCRGCVIMDGSCTTRPWMRSR